MPKKQNKKQLLPRRPIRSKRILPITAILLFAVGGAYWVLHSNAATIPDRCAYVMDNSSPPRRTTRCSAWVPNPPLARSCGLDVLLLIDTSFSMQGKPLDDASNAVSEFVKALQGTQTLFAVSDINKANVTNGTPPVFTADPEVIRRRILSMQGNQGSSDLIGINGIKTADPRHERPNLIIVLSDFKIGYYPWEAGETKQNGTRILGLVYGTNQGQLSPEAKTAVEYVTGPNINTGGIINSDAITVRTETINAAFAQFGKDLCFSGNNGIGTAGSGTGNNGDGGGAIGAGTGTTGQGTGPGAGASAGGGGSSANRQAEQPSPLPSSSAQGEVKESPTVEPSPFFDGKDFAPGSDPIDKALGNVNVGGKRILHGWLYLLGLFIVVASSAAGYFLWWRRLSEIERVQWKGKLHLG